MRSCELSIIIPTLNEVDNIEELSKKIINTIPESISWEVIFVDDDSPDGTSISAKKIAFHDPRFRCLRRINRRGLAGAFIEGALSSSASFVALMDADHQHDETLLPQMFDLIKKEDLDLVIGSRYLNADSMENWHQSRRNISRYATNLSKWVLKADLTDPLSGFFLIKRKTFDLLVKNLTGIGFKILIDIFTASKTPLKFKEVPYQFKNRFKGESKLDSTVAWEFGLLLIGKWTRGLIPIRFLSFSIIGLFGVFVHMAILILAFKWFGLEFYIGQSLATAGAIAANFALNNILTYSDKRLKGWSWLKGLMSFYFVCSLGAIANVATADWLFEKNVGWLLAALGGIFVSAVWNYALSATFTWKK